MVARLLRVAVGLVSLVLLAVGLWVVDLQEARSMRAVGLAVGIALVAGSLLCLVGVALGRRRGAGGAMVAGAALLSAGVLVPSHLTLGFPLVAIVWGYAYMTNRSAPA